MKVVTVRDFRDRATEMLRSTDVIFITRDGRPAGFFIPWESDEIPAEVRGELCARAVELHDESAKKEEKPRDLDALYAAAGGWKGLVDPDKLIADIYESRRVSTCPPVEL